MHTAIPSSASSKKAPWNKGHLIGQKRPLKPKDVWAIRVRLQLEGLGPPRLDRGKPFFDQRLRVAPGGLVDAPGGDLLDEELGEGPHQRVGAVR